MAEERARNPNLISPKAMEAMASTAGSGKELISEINYESKIDFIRLKNSRKQIDNNYIIMQNFLKQLP